MPKLNKCIYRKKKEGFQRTTKKHTHYSTRIWFACQLKLDENEHTSFTNMKCDGRNCGNYTPYSCYVLFDVKMQDGKVYRNVISVHGSIIKTETALLTFHDRQTLVVNKDQVLEVKGKKPDWSKLICEINKEVKKKT